MSTSARAPGPGVAEERRKRVTRALANPVYFGEYYVRPYTTGWDEPLPQFGKEMLAFSLSVQRGVIILAPEFLKTTLCSQVLPLWLTYTWTVEGRLLRGMLLSEEEGMATNNLSVVKWHIEHNAELRADFCDAQGRPLVYPDPDEAKWSETSIIVARHGASKDPTWEAKGLNSTGIQGRRLDWLIGDDVITPASAFSPAKRKAAIDLWDMQITTRLVGHGVALMCGNFNDSRDLVSTLSKRPGYRTFKRPALHKPGEPSVPAGLDDTEAVELWPSNWPKVRLRKEAREKPNRFRRIFLLDAKAETGERLNVEWVTVIEPEQTPLKYCRFYIGIDPAPGGDGDDLDFFNITIGAMHETHLDVIECRDLRASTPDQCDLVGLLHDRYQRLGYGVVVIGGAKVALDAYFRGALVVARPDLKHKIEDMSTPGHKEQRLEGLGPKARSGWVRVWESVWQVLTSDLHDQHQESTLFDQWRDFPFGSHDDKLDGLDIMLRTAEEFAAVGDHHYDLEVLEA